MHQQGWLDENFEKCLSSLETIIILIHLEFKQAVSTDQNKKQVKKKNQINANLFELYSTSLVKLNLS